MAYQDIFTLRRQEHPPATKFRVAGGEDPNQYSQYSLDEGTAPDTLTSWDVLKSWGCEDVGNIDSPGYVINLRNVDNLGR